MAEKYGVPGKTDDEGFDPYADSVGAGIYGGIVKRDTVTGAVVIGRQYQNHNPRPGPVYAGGGYAPVAKALKDVKGRLLPLLTKFPDLANDITTGGAQPLHMCGMSRENQLAVETLIKLGADVEALDTYGMTPLHRMASNNLAVGARMLLQAGADATNKGKVGATPREIAMQSHAVDVLKVLDDKSLHRVVAMSRLRVMGAGVGEVNGEYEATAADKIPAGFAAVCMEQKWSTKDMWAKLNGGADWYKHVANGSYIYRNKADGKWWIDAPSGLGVYIVDGPTNACPAHGWKSVGGDKVGEARLPTVLTFRRY